jgi:lincosamide nucleotidyltransferase A/C/D/E
VDAADVVEVVSLLQAAGARVWIVGGWAIDALLGRETRPHGDLDLVVEAASMPTALAAMEAAGFHLAHEVVVGRWLSVQVKLYDGMRRGVALHPIDPGAWAAPAGPESVRQSARELGLGEVSEVFATGRLAEHDVPSLSPAAQVVLRCGYEIRELDRQDVAALCQQFGLPAPLPYAGAPSGAGPAASG